MRTLVEIPRDSVLYFYPDDKNHVTVIGTYEGIYCVPERVEDVQQWFDEKEKP